MHVPVFRIQGSVTFWPSRIRIPDPLVRCVDPDLAPDQNPSIIKQNSKKNLYFYCFVTSVWLFIFEEWCKCTFKKNKQKTRFFLLASWRSLTKRAASISVSQRYRSADTNPDTYQNLTDPEHWFYCIDTDVQLTFVINFPQTNVTTSLLLGLVDRIRQIRPRTKPILTPLHTQEWRNPYCITNLKFKSTKSWTFKLFSKGDIPTNNRD
jgi:hypothetical protein